MAANRFTKLNTIQMAPSSVTRLASLPKATPKLRALIIVRLSPLLPRVLLFAAFYLLLLLVIGLFTNLMFRMPFSMVTYRRSVEQIVT